jgi:hypothetical protein
MRTLLTLLAGLSLATAQAQKPLSLRLQNPLALARPSETVVLARAALERASGAIPAGQVPVFTPAGGQPLPAQLDDLNGDGRWDEAALLVSLAARQLQVVRVTWVPAAQAPAFPVRAQARLAKLVDGKFVPVTAETMPATHRPTDFAVTPVPPYQVEGPAWENDKVAFRLYFDQRNGKDIFGKTTPDLVLDRVGQPGDDYHKQAPWGMDVLKVGASLGAGAVALVGRNAEGHETLFRLGENVQKTDYHFISSGPVRALFALDYHGWQPQLGLPYHLTDLVSLGVGQYFYESTLTLSGFTGQRQLATGIVNLYCDSARQTTQKGYATLATHAKQSENKDHLGMALAVDRASFAGFGQTPETGPEKVLQTFYLKMNARPDVPVKYRFFAGWEPSDPRFANAAQFHQWVAEEAQRMAAPIKVKIGAAK